MMFGPKIYSVYLKPKAKEPLETVELIQEGFSFPAFILTGLWTLYHRLWVASFMVFAVNFCVTLWTEAAGHNVSITAYLTVIQLGLSVIVSLCGNDWRAQKLERRGYQLVDVVTGGSRIEAERRFFERYLHGKAEAQLAGHKRSPMPTDGLLVGA